MRTMIRGIIDAVVEGAIKRITLKGFAGESITDREYFQHYGYTSRPLSGAEAIVLREGNHFIIIASDDRRYRLVIDEGEVAIYDHLGQKIHLKKDNSIEVITNLLLVKAAVKVRFETPLIETTGEIQAVSEITDRRDTNGRSMNNMREIYNNHDHPGDSGGTTGDPNQEM